MPFALLGSFKSPKCPLKLPLLIPFVTTHSIAPRSFESGHASCSATSPFSENAVALAAPHTVSQADLTRGNQVGHTLTDHYGRGVGVRPHHIGKDGRVGHANALKPVDPQPLVNHRHRV